MDVYLTEEEQVEQLKRWWKQYGLSIIVGVALGLLIMYGWQAWQAHQTRHAKKASIAYGQLLAKVDEGNADALIRQGKQIIKSYPETPYAAFASLFLASQAVSTSKLDEAESHLRWAIEHTHFTAIKQIARVRAARVLYAEGQADKALQMLDDVDDPNYAVLTNEVRGDILQGIGKSKEALVAYEKASAAGLESQMLRPLLDMKLNNLQQNLGASNELTHS